MNAKIVKFSINYAPSRAQAMGWLATNSIRFPDSIPGHVGKELFFGWRFIAALDGVIYFANCISEGITKDDVLAFKKNGLNGRGFSRRN